MVAYVTFLRDVACQKLLNSANVSRSYSQNNTGTVFLDTVYIHHDTFNTNTLLYTGYKKMHKTNCESVSPLHWRKKPRFFCPCLSGVFMLVRGIAIIFLSAQCTTHVFKYNWKKQKHHKQKIQKLLICVNLPLSDTEILYSKQSHKSVPVAQWAPLAAVHADWLTGASELPRLHVQFNPRPGRGGLLAAQCSACTLWD